MQTWEQGILEALENALVQNDQLRHQNDNLAALIGEMKREREFAAERIADLSRYIDRIEAAS